MEVRESGLKNNKCLFVCNTLMINARLIPIFDGAVPTASSCKKREMRTSTIET